MLKLNVYTPSKSLGSRLTTIYFRCLYQDTYIDVKPKFDDKSDTVIEVSVHMNSLYLSFSQRKKLEYDTSFI